MGIQDQIQIILWAIGIANTVTLFMLSLYGKWIWDLNKKIAISVTGPECEVRNKDQYADTEQLRLEVKEDFKELRRTIQESVKDMTKSNQSCVDVIAQVVEKLGNKN